MIVFWGFLSSASSITRRHFCGIAPGAAHKFTHLLKLQVATLSLGPSSRNSRSHRTDSCRDLLLLKDASIDGRSANLTSGWTYRQRVGPLTGHLRHHCLRDPPVPQERFDLLLHHAAVPPASTHTHTQLGRERRRTRAPREPRGDFETKAFSKKPLFWMD